MNLNMLRSGSVKLVSEARAMWTLNRDDAWHYLEWLLGTQFVQDPDSLKAILDRLRWSSQMAHRQGGDAPEMQLIPDDKKRFNPRRATINDIVAMAVFKGNPENLASWLPALGKAYAVRKDIVDNHYKWDFEVPMALFQTLDVDNILDHIKSGRTFFKYNTKVGRYMREHGLQPFTAGRISAAILEIIEIGQLIWAIWETWSTGKPLTDFDEFFDYKIREGKIRYGVAADLGRMSESMKDAYVSTEEKVPSVPESWEEKKSDAQIAAIKILGLDRNISTKAESIIMNLNYLPPKQQDIVILKLSKSRAMDPQLLNELITSLDRSKEIYEMLQIRNPEIVSRLGVDMGEYVIPIPDMEEKPEETKRLEEPAKLEKPEEKVRKQEREYITYYNKEEAENFKKQHPDLELEEIPTETGIAYKFKLPGPRVPKEGPEAEHAKEVMKPLEEPDSEGSEVSSL